MRRLRLGALLRQRRGGLSLCAHSVVALPLYAAPLLCHVAVQARDDEAQLLIARPRELAAQLALAVFELAAQAARGAVITRGARNARDTCKRSGGNIRQYI